MGFNNRMKIFDIINNFVKKNRGMTSLYIISVIILYSVKDIIIPRIFGQIFDQQTQLKQRKFLIIFGIIFGLLLVYNIFYVLVDKSISSLVPRFSTYANNLIYKLILERYNEDYQEVKMGETITNLILLPGNLKEFFIEITNVYFPSIIIIAIINIYYYFLDWRIGLLITGSILVSFLVFFLSVKKCGEYSYQRHKMFEDSNEYTTDRLNNILNILASAKSKDEIKEREKVMLEYENIYKKTMLCNGNISSILVGINSFFILMVFGLTFYLYKKKSITLSIMITILVILLMYLSHILYMSTDLPILVHYFGFFKSGEKFLDNINLPEDKKGADKKKTGKFAKGDIILKDITYQFENGYKVFDSYNGRFKNATINGIDGKSGRGKTTLINLLLRLYVLTSGEIYVGNKKLSDMSTETIRNNIALVTQKPKLFNESIYYNIKYRNPRVTDTQIRKTIKEYGLDDVFAEVDLNRKAGVNGDNLSGGQKQIVIILRTILNNSPIIIMDEPTASIDVHHKKYITALIKKLKNRGKMLIVISHDPELQKIYENKISL